MDNLGSEVGHKMRSAVKAKLIELGTGSSTGYIDDELPDYVMIMVANKRSKVQMLDDLSLFLGKNTEMFVSWLHQVLEKLQEVSLPPTSISKSKKRTSESGDKKDKKKKKLRRGAKEKTPENKGSSTPPHVSKPAIPSITDVFADHLIQKAKKTFSDADSASVKKKEEVERNIVNDPKKKTTDEFDIPTITEIAKNAVGEVVRRKEITELAELQIKINEAKKQLRHMTSEESEDEDFINLKADGEELGAENDNNASSTSQLRKRSESYMNSSRESDKPKRVPITFRGEKERVQKVQNDKRSNDKEDRDHRDRELVEKRSGDKEKRSVLDRLGTRTANENIVSLSTHRRAEQQIYVPSFRRNEPAKIDDRDKEKDRSREKTRENIPRDSRDLRERVRERERGRSDVLRERERKRDKDFDRGRNLERSPKLSQRIGSRVIVPPPKPDYDEDRIVVPVNSVVKVQPRPVIPKQNQASKNLLLRAMAEAQKSIAAVKPREIKPPVKERLQGLYTSTYRQNKIQKNIAKSNIVIEVANGQPQFEHEEVEDEDIDEIDEEEYCPVSTHEEANEEEEYEYVLQSMEETSDEDNGISSEKSTQFVVTLDAKEFLKRQRQCRLGPSIDNDSSEVTEHIAPLKKQRFEKVLKGKTASPLRTEVGQKVNKLIIQNDTEDEEELRKEVENSSQPKSRKRRNVSPIKFDVILPPKPEEPKGRVRKSPSDNGKDGKDGKDGKVGKDGKDGKSDEDSNAKRHSSTENLKIKTSKTSNRKYDNLPPLSSTITAIVDNKPKSKERCKYYPTCGKGDRCEFYHPSTPCKTFPNCKFGDSCLYTHPKCKFDLTCSRLGCNFSHTPVSSAAPPLSSQVVPVSNYKKISANPLPALCRFYPQCSNTLCEFYHPKPCKFGKNCTNKVECNFYHFEIPSTNRLKWVATTT